MQSPIKDSISFDRDGTNMHVGVSVDIPQVKYNLEGLVTIITTYGVTKSDDERYAVIVKVLN
jgi:hypothetical protein